MPMWEAAALQRCQHPPAVPSTAPAPLPALPPAQVRIRRPADYNAAAAAPLGPSMPNPNLNLAAIGLDKAALAAAAATGGGGGGGGGGGSLPPQQAGLSEVDAANRIFVGGLPYYLTGVCRAVPFAAVPRNAVLRVVRQCGAAPWDAGPPAHPPNRPPAVWFHRLVCVQRSSAASCWARLAPSSSST